jgi:membrane protein YqaA with SNARE-associated domain
MIEYLSLFVSSFLSATLLPGSSEAVLAGMIVMTDHPVAALIGVATLGNTLGASINWTIGLLVARGSSKIRLPVTPQQVDKFGRWYTTYGVWTLLFSWVPVIGDVLTTMAGLVRTPLVVFLPVVAAGKALRYLAVAGIVQWSILPG